MRRRLERSHDLRVHIYSHLLLGHYLAIACLGLLEHPVSEGLASQRVNEIDDPLAWQLPQVIIFREVRFDLRVLTSLDQELLHTKTLVLRYRQVLHLVAV